MRDMSESTIDYRDCDRQIWEEELADFVPSRVSMRTFISTGVLTSLESAPDNPPTMI